MAKRTIRPIRIIGNIALVTLTKGMTATIDACDVPLVEDRNWYALRGWGDCWYAAAHIKKGEPGFPRAVLMHVKLMGYREGMFIDHEDGDGLNNRRNNMRRATRSQNGCNRGATRKNTSGAKGVHLCRITGRWRAEISVAGKQTKLGRFDTVEEAAAAYAKAAAELHGDFAFINRD